MTANPWRAAKGKPEAGPTEASQCQQEHTTGAEDEMLNLACAVYCMGVCV